MAFGHITNKLNSSSPRALPLNECLAKTIQLFSQPAQPGCTVEAHLEATYFVAKQLLNILKTKRAGELFDSRVLIGPLLHDIGKLTPGFQDKIYNALGRSVHLTFGNLSEMDKNENHAVAGFCTFQSNDYNYPGLAQICASHHGSFCNAGLTSEKTFWVGQHSWAQMRRELIHRLCDRFHLPLSDLPDKTNVLFPLYLGLTTVADWISSSAELRQGESLSEEQACELVQKAGFRSFEMKRNLSFHDVFPFDPNHLQKKAAESVYPGGIYVLEIEMGAGKTEAALYLAYKLLAEHKHSGIYFALPTQLTSEKIYDRFNPFLDIILDDSQPKRRSLLLHGRAWLKNSLSEDCDDPEKAKNYLDDAWFDQRKRGLLAPFAVGTIDQLLMAVINVRHNYLRAFGAAGKVIILDEIHSYDAYTGTLIKVLIEKLRNWGCTVIILSATLTHQHRHEFILDTSPISSQENAYPLLSINDGNRISYYPIPSTAKKEVAIRHSDNLERSLQHVIQHAQNGESVLWIENTVAQSQEIYKMLRGRIDNNIEIGLVHSRFQYSRRQENENYWTNLLGKDTTASIRQSGKILIGTQVLEQSLDIDADYLVTRLCPTDMLLQRIGRLWRHRIIDAFRPQGALCIAEILNEKPYSNSEKKNIKNETRKYVYAPYVLVRSEEVFKEINSIELPRDIRSLMEQTYAPRPETGYYLQLQEELASEVNNLQRKANINSGNAYPTGDDSEYASTRSSDQPTIELLLIEDYLESERLIKIWGCEKYMRIPPVEAEKSRKSRVAAKLYKYMVRIGLSMAPEYVNCPWLEHILPLRTVYADNVHPLQAAFINESGTLLNASKLPLNVAQRQEQEVYTYTYDNELGFYREK